MVVNWVSNKRTTSYVRVYEGNEYVSEQGHTEYTYSHEVKVVGLEPEKSYRYQLRWTDSSGNLGESQWYETKTSAAPSVRNFSYSVFSTSRVLLSWETSELATCAIEYGSGSLDHLVEISGYGTSFSKELTDLQAGSNYQIRVVARTQDRFPFYYSLTFQTPPYPSISSLTFQEQKETPTPTISVSWKTNVETTSAVFYREKGKGGNYKEVSSSKMTKEHSLSISGLKPQTEYEVYTQGRDKYGNLAQSDINTITTSIDTRPPTISNITIQTEIQGQGRDQKATLIVTWKTDEPSTSQVEYAPGIEGEFTLSSAEDPNLSEYHTVIIPNLNPESIYHLRVISKDKANNRSLSDSLVFITAKPKESVYDLILKVLNKYFGWMIKKFRR